MAKVIFIGTTDFGIPTLEYLKQNHDLLFVITQPDKPAGRKKVLTAPAVKMWAETNGVKILQPQKIENEIETIQTASPDVMIVAAYGQIIPQSVLDAPKHGCINLHTSLLPKYRGASPIQAALLNDDKQTGVSIILMDHKMDHGPLLSTHPIQISDSDTYPTLNAKLAQIAAAGLAETLPKWLSGKLSPTPQNHDQATFVKTLRRDDARIDWTQSARKIFKQTQALNPEPGTWTTLDKKSVKILQVEEIRNGRIDLPGKIYSEHGDCLVKCGDYSLKLINVQPEGKKEISGRDFLNGLRNLETKVLI
jgi:methionyl-tRNA formyltransferase